MLDIGVSSRGDADATDADGRTGRLGADHEQPTSVVARAGVGLRVTAARLARMRCRSLVTLDDRGAPAGDTFGDEDLPMDDATYFERLAANVARVAHHPHFPAKTHALELCLQDIDDLSLAGRITAEQAGVLRALLGSTCRAA